MCRMKQRCISPAERDHVWMGAEKKDVQLILYVIKGLKIGSTASKFVKV